VFSFPDPVNEVSARLVAGGVALVSLTTIVFAQPWLTALGCKAFAALMRAGAIPPEVCERCNDITAAGPQARTSG
jgi:hypothetical protein